jgi:hypothetical protein
VDLPKPRRGTVQCRLQPAARCFERSGRDPDPLLPNVIVWCALIEFEIKAGRELTLEMCSVSIEFEIKTGRELTLEIDCACDCWID